MGPREARLCGSRTGRSPDALGAQDSRGGMHGARLYAHAMVNSGVGVQLRFQEVRMQAWMQVGA